MDKKLKEKIRIVKERMDAVGRDMDQGIVETVAILNLLGFPTSGSCEGHTDHGIANPWVDIQAENRPNERFINEASIKDTIAKDFGISSEQVGWGENENANSKFWDTVENIDETLEYKEWNTKNKQLAERLNKLIADFYINSKPEKSLAIHLKKVWGLAGRVQAGPDEEIGEKLEMREEKLLIERLLLRQEEMTQFTSFLKKIL